MLSKTTPRGAREASCHPVGDQHRQYRSNEVICAVDRRRFRASRGADSIFSSLARYGEPEKTLITHSMVVAGSHRFCIVFPCSSFTERVAVQAEDVSTSMHD